MVAQRKMLLQLSFLFLMILIPAWVNASVAPSVDPKMDRSAVKSPFDQAQINWQQFKGESIHVLLSGHPIQGTIMSLLPEFKALTGISVVVDVLPEEDFFQTLYINFKRGQGDVDVFMTSPLYQWQYAKAGWIEDLNVYLDNPLLTDKRWFNPDDFFPVLWKASMWNGAIGGGLGQGALYSIPVWWEGTNLMYRKDLAATYGFVEPENWDELYQQASLISKSAKGTLQGFTGRGIRSWSQIHTYHLTMMASQGGRDLDPLTGKADFNSPVGIEVGQYWIKMMRDASMSKWLQYNWYEVAEEFQAGEYFAIMDANPFAIILEAKGSPIRGKVGYLLPPPGVKGQQSSLWLWSFGMNSFSKHKGASWLFIQWITSQHMLHKAIEYNNWMAPRQSVWFSPDVTALLRTIDNGRWYENATKLVTHLADMRWSPNPLAPIIGNLWAGAIQDTWYGKNTIEQALNKAAADVNELMKEAGYSKE